MILGQWAKMSGAYKVFYTDIDRRKLSFAEDFGFNAYNGETVDAAVEGTGHSSQIALCLEAAASKGTVVLMGNPSGDISLTQKEYWHILRKQLTVKGTWNSVYNKFRDEWRVTAEAIASGLLNIKPLITHRFALGDCARAFEIIRKKEEFIQKAVFVL
jgi:L-iditol 2-dehydrogenase